MKIYELIIFIYDKIIFCNMVISNSSPLINLTKIGKIKYLLGLTEEIKIPIAVYNETVTKGKKMNFLEAFIIEKYIQEKKIKIISLKPFNKSIYPPLGKGELESIELSKRTNELLLIDDKKARNLAEILGIKFQTTIATIFELLISGMINITNYRTNIKKYAQNSWISADILQDYIEKGEKYGR